MSAPSRAAIENAISRRVGYEAATDADVPGREGSTASQIATYDQATLGFRVLVANGNRYTKTSMTPYGLGGRITQEDTGNATQLQGRNISTTAPADGEAMTWVASTSKWTPMAIPTTPLASASPLALAASASPGTSAFAAHGDHVHPTTGLGVLAAGQTWTGNNLWIGPGSYQLVGFEVNTRNIGFFNAAPKPQAAALPAVALNAADVAASFASLGAWITAIGTGLNTTGGVGLFAG